MTKENNLRNTLIVTQNFALWNLFKNNKGDIFNGYQFKHYRGLLQHTHDHDG